MRIKLDRTILAGLAPGGRILCFCAMSLLAVSCGASVNASGFSTALPILVIAGHAVWALRYRSHPNLLSAAAYQTYFLGFLSTVVAILFSLLHVLQEPSLLTDMSYVCKSVGMALSATVAALICMNALSAIADAQETGANVAVPPGLTASLDRMLAALAQSQIPPAMKTIVDDFGRILADLKESAQTARGLATGLADVHTAMNRLQDQLRRSTASLDAFSSSSGQADAQAKAYASAVGQLQQVVDGMVVLLERRIDRELRVYDEEDQVA